MQRTVFQESQIDGFRSQKTETIAFSSFGNKKTFFAGSPDGVLSSYQLNMDAGIFLYIPLQIIPLYYFNLSCSCRVLIVYLANNKASCVLVDNLRKAHGRDKKAITCMTVVEVC